MSEYDNDNISKFFRKAVQEPQIRFEERDWEKLEARLNDASGNSNHNRWKSAFIAAVTLLAVSIGFLSYLIFKPSVAIEKTSTDNATVTSNMTTVGPPEKERLSMLERKEESKNLKSNKEHEKITQTYPIPTAIIKHNKLSILKTEPVNERNMNLALNHGKENKTGAVHQPAVSNMVNEIFEEEGFSKRVVSGTTIPTDSSLVPDDKISNSEEGLKGSETIPALTKSSRWNLMLLFSPDFSSTSMHRFTAPGKSFGVFVYYNVSKAFSVSVGVLKSNKIYWDNGSAYHPVEAGFWGKRTNGVIPERVEGACSVLEIPIGVQYNIASLKKGRVYLAAAFSSYVMLNESYQYVFDTPNPGASETWHAKETSRDLFSIGTVTAGFERKISNRMLIGLSPYIKIPLSGIGAWADVKLYSMGAAFTLRYQFQKIKRPDRMIPAD